MANRPETCDAAVCAKYKKRMDSHEAQDAAGRVLAIIVKGKGAAK